MSQTLVGSGLLFAGGLVKHWPFLCILVHLEKERMEAISLCVGLPTGLFFHQIIMKEKWSDPHSSLPPSPHFPFFPFPSHSLPFPPTPSLPSSLTSPPHNVLCTHSWNAHLCCHCSLLPSVLEDRGQDRLV